MLLIPVASLQISQVLPSWNLSAPLLTLSFPDTDNSFYFTIKSSLLKFEYVLNVKEWVSQQKCFYTFQWSPPACSNNWMWSMSVKYQQKDPFYRITEPQHHRITEWFGLEGTFTDHPVQPSCHGLEQLSLDQAAQIPHFFLLWDWVK